MKYETHNDTYIDVDGTCLQGRVGADYKQLVRLFGQPTEGDGCKTDAEWEVKFSDGVVATIYNWKDGHNFCGEGGKDTNKIKRWNVGGRSQSAIVNVLNILEK